MVHVEEMIRRSPATSPIDRDALARCIERCLACAQSCTACADACLAERDVNALAGCIRLNMDCADICETTARVLSRQLEFPTAAVRRLVEACIAACAACGEECEMHARDMEHCRVCADACRECKRACEAVLASL